MRTETSPTAKQQLLKQVTTKIYIALFSQAFTMRFSSGSDGKSSAA